MNEKEWIGTHDARPDDAFPSRKDRSGMVWGCFTLILVYCIGVVVGSIIAIKPNVVYDTRCGVDLYEATMSGGLTIE